MKKLFSEVVGIFILLLINSVCNDEVCDRRPLGTKADALRPDNQFILEVDKIKENQYIPEAKYKVILRSTYENTSFIAFTISLKEDTVYNKLNPRKPTHLHPGHLKLFDNSSLAKYSPVCNNTIIQSDVTAKKRVEVLWQAPVKENRCVVIFAVVAITKDIWYSYEPPLSLKVCEDPRKSEDMPPAELDGDCGTCEDARFRLTFEGLWSYNTHQVLFPTAREQARFSDVVGASHSPDTSLFNLGSEATIGIKMLAEQGNTTQFEIETQSKLPSKVRTVIKASHPEKTIMSTTTTFRASPQHHRLSIAVGILPSPDWFLGVSHLELCDDKDKQWKGSIKLNLYPIDAGTDKGVDFESSNEEQSPFQPITQLSKIGKAGTKPDKPFARILVERVRTYMTPQCSSMTQETQTEDGVDNSTNGAEEPDTSEPIEVRPYVTRRPRVRTTTTTTTTTTTSESPPAVDPNSSDECPMTNWEEWQECEGPCVDDTVVGVQTRVRYHVVDGVVIKDIDHRSPVSQYCIENYSEMDFRPCRASCAKNGEEEAEEVANEAEAEASQRTWHYSRGKK